MAVALGLALCVSLSASAVVELQPINDGVDRNDPNFVTAYLMVLGQGSEMFSCVGHTFIRLQCPTFKLDSCYSYESESVSDKVMTFLCGNLKMGMFRFESEKVLKEYYAAQGRGVWQYQLNLPPLVKQRLWKILDDKVAEGADVPYDYSGHGCASETLAVLKEAFAPVELTGPRCTSTRRETFYREAGETHPWSLFLINSIVGTEVDCYDLATPTQLLGYLQRAKAVGAAEPIITDPGKMLYPQAARPETTTLSPMMAAGLFAALAAVNFFLPWAFLDWLFLAFRSAYGAFLVYLVTASALPTSCWNWLLVPFNPLPLVLWRGRRRWVLGFAALLALWGAGMIVWPHRLVEPALLVVGLAYIVFYLKLAVRTNGGQLKPFNKLNGHFKQ